MTERKAVEIELVDPTDDDLSIVERQSLSLDQFREFEESLYQESAAVVDAAVSFADIEPDQAEVPETWVKTFGRRQAKKRFRIAKAAWMNRQEAPVGLLIAQTTFLGIKRLREADTGPTTLNIGYVTMVAPVAEYPAIEVQGKTK